MISRNLAVALRETIRAHAQQHHGGKMDRDRMLSALGELAADFLAEVTNTVDRYVHYSKLVVAISRQMARKAANDKRSTTAH
jgi:hypothetical protein